MARVAYTDLFVNFTIDANSHPNTTQVPKVIIRVYQQVYEVVYGPGHYTATDTDDPKTIVISDEMFAEIAGLSEERVQLWHEASPPTPINAGQPMPIFRLSLVDKDRILGIAWNLLIREAPVKNIRLWNEAQDDIVVR